MDNVHTKFHENRSTSSKIEKLEDSHTQHGDLICLWFLLIRKESRLKINSR